MIHLGPNLARPRNTMERRPWILLVAAIVMISCVPGEVLAVMPFIKMDLDDSSWDRSLTTDQSFLACSVRCQRSYPTCQIFAWIDNKCYNGTVVYTWARANSGALVFVAQEIKMALTFQNQLATRIAGADSIFNDKTGIFGQELLAMARTTMTFYEAYQLCTDAGGRLLSLRDEGLLHYILDHLLDQPVSHDIGFWLDLEPIAFPLDCQNEVCNGKMVWGDNATYQHPSFIECTSVGFFRPDSAAIWLHHPNGASVSCGTFAHPFSGIGSFPKNFRGAGAVCQFDP